MFRLIIFLYKAKCFNIGVPFFTDVESRGKSVEAGRFIAEAIPLSTQVIANANNFTYRMLHRKFEIGSQFISLEFFEASLGIVT